jgi:hypothetical protein
LIGHISKGGDFHGIFDYVLSPSKSPQIIGGNVFGSNVLDFTRRFQFDAQRNRAVSHPVRHFSISLAPEDGFVSTQTKESISHQVMLAMGYLLPEHGSPSFADKLLSSLYLVVSHGRDDPDHDRSHDHDHFHIVANAINPLGGRVSDSFDYFRLDDVLRQLERDFSLRQVPSCKKRIRRAPSHGQHQRWAKELEEVATGVRDLAAPPVSEKLQSFIDAVSTDRPSVSVFLDRLLSAGVSVRSRPVTVKGRSTIGLSYHFEGVSFQGSDLHASLFRLVERGKVSFLPDRDLPSLIALAAPSILSLKQSLQSAISLASTGHPSLSAFTDRLLAQRVSVSITRAADRSTIRGISYSYQGQKWSGSQLNATWPQLQALGVDMEPELSFDVSDIELPPPHLHLSRSLGLKNNL